MRKNLIQTCFLVAVLLFACLSSPSPSLAKEDVYATYTIQEGDFLSVVAMMFDTSVEEILDINDISDVNAISIGTKIKIPSLAGIEGEISTKYLNVGDTLSTLSIISGMNKKTLADINNIVSPTELFLGSLITTIYNPNAEGITAVGSYDASLTGLETSAMGNMNPEFLMKSNEIRGSWDYSDKQVLFAESEHTQGTEAVHSVSPLLDQVEIKQLPLVQGETHVIHVQTPYNLTLSGTVGEQNLRFFKNEGTNDWYAMLGIDAMADTGLIPFTLNGTSDTGESFQIEQPVILQAGIFTNEVVEGVDPSTLEADNQIQDTNLVHSLNTSNLPKLWGNGFSYPVDEPCFASAFGSRRSYNDGSFYNYHSGIDYAVCLADNINIYAVADGTVVFASELPIHGNYTVIDHGWGVYSTYSHQSQQVVTAGQQVKRGELIGLIGNTGRSVGPHLHLEVIINSVYVNPLTWLNTTFP